MAVALPVRPWRQGLTVRRLVPDDRPTTGGDVVEIDAASPESAPDGLEEFARWIHERGMQILDESWLMDLGNRPLDCSERASVMALRVSALELRRIAVRGYPWFHPNTPTHLLRCIIDDFRGGLHGVLLTAEEARLSLPFVAATAPSGLDGLCQLEGLANRLEDFITQLRSLLLQSVPDDPIDDYLDWGIAAARLLAGVGPVWDRLMDLRALVDRLGMPEAADIRGSCNGLRVSWGRLQQAFKEGASQDQIAVHTTAVHERLAGLASLMVRQVIGLRVRLGEGDYESRRLSAKRNGDLVETFVGIEKDVFRSARELAFATTSQGHTPAGWDAVPATFPSISYMLEELAAWTGFGGRFDTA